MAGHRLADGKGGSIINIASIRGISGQQNAPVAYQASKGAVINLTRNLAASWADRNVRVNVIAPGWTETDFTGDLFASRWGEKLLADIPLGRYAAAEELTGAAVFFASRASSYVTGAVLSVDGGRALR